MNNLNKLICIEYPGVVKNVDKMLETLGGLENLNKVFLNPSLRLQLRFRPNDPFSHSAIADKLQLNSLLVRTTKNLIHYSDGTSEIKYKTVIVGLIESTYRFETLADFQYIPIQRTNFNAQQIIDQVMSNDKSNVMNVSVDEENQQTDQVNGQQINDEEMNNLSNESKQLFDQLDNEQPSTYKSIFKQVYPFKALNGEIREFDEAAPLFVMPIIFSRFDSPSDYFYKDDPKTRKPLNESKRKLYESTISLNRKSRSKYVYLVAFNEEPPEERAIVEDDSTVDSVLLAKIRKEFELYPIWSKIELAYRNKCKRKELKYILPICGFYYTNGPFRGQWVRFGFNPKLDNSSRFHQTLDLRITVLLNRRLGATERRKVVVYDSVKSHKPEKKLRENTITPDKFQNTNEYSMDKNIGRFRRRLVNEEVDELDFKFRSGQVPRSKQVFYQLRNIELDQVKQILENEEPKDHCDEKDGWWPIGTIDKIRSLMSNQVDKHFDNDSTINSNLDDDEDKEEIDDVEEEIMEYYN